MDIGKEIDRIDGKIHELENEIKLINAKLKNRDLEIIQLRKTINNVALEAYHGSR